MDALRDMGENTAYATKKQPHTQEMEAVTAEMKMWTGQSLVAHRCRSVQPSHG